MAREYIEREDLLNQGRVKLNKSIDKSYDAEANSLDAKNIANQSTEISNEAKDIAANTNERLNNVLASEMKDGEVIDFRKSQILDHTFNVINERGDFWDKEFIERGINVKWFGAKGDGIADDTTFLKEAIKKAKETNNFVYIPKGIYVISDKIKLFQGCKIVGSEDRPALYFNSKNSGIENSDRMVSVKNMMLQLSSDVDKTGTVGINFHGTETEYAAYCELNNLFVVGFGTNVRLNKIFEVDLKRVIGRDSNACFDFDDVTTLLNVSDSYALNNKKGWSIKKVHYSSLTNIASDQNEEPYLFEDNHGVVINGMGMEKNSGCCVINDSTMSINGLVGVLNSGKEKRPSFIEVNGNSKLSLTSAKEVSLNQSNMSVHSIAVGNGSVVSLETTTIKKPIYHNASALIYGNINVEENIVSINGKNYIHSGSGPYGNKCPKYINDGKYKVGDKYVNDDFSTKRPAIEWTCIVAGETGEWRAVFAYNSGPFLAKPVLETGYNFFGFRYAVTDASVPYEIVWLGNKWLETGGVNQN